MQAPVTKNLNRSKVIDHTSGLWVKTHFKRNSRVRSLCHNISKFSELKLFNIDKLLKMNFYSILTVS